MYKKGFTLIELLVTVSIMVILMTIAFASFGTAREQARDAQRKTDLRTVEAALALYKNKYGRYPTACNGPTVGSTPRFSGQLDADAACTSGSVQYIVGLAPEFIPKLPVDLKLNSDATIDSGFVYAVNNEGSVYKFMALNTVETEEVERGSEFSRCDTSWNLGTGSVSYEDPGLCRRTPATAGGTGSGPTAVCNTSSLYQTSYSVSAGFSSDSRGATNSEAGQEYDTEVIRCG
jgi:prepilin-type N-terminal cleavage/methylation domain-containing protein